MFFFVFFHGLTPWRANYALLLMCTVASCAAMKSDLPL